jgi:hypothetical protein
MQPNQQKNKNKNRQQELMKVLLRPTNNIQQQANTKATNDQIEKSPNCSKL